MSFFISRMNLKRPDIALRVRAKLRELYGEEAATVQIVIYSADGIPNTKGADILRAHETKTRLVQDYECA